MHKRTDLNSPCHGLGGACTPHGEVCPQVASGFWGKVCSLGQLDNFPNLLFVEAGSGLFGFSTSKGIIYPLSLLVEVTTSWSKTGKVKICPSRQQPGQCTGLCFWPFAALILFPKIRGNMTKMLTHFYQMPVYGWGCRDACRQFTTLSTGQW